MKKLAIIGSNGMLGSDLVEYLSPSFFITKIFKGNYSKHINKTFDVVLNANGNSKRFWANKNPQDDFLASTVSVYKSIFDFPCDIYIYISSSDVYENHSGPKYTRENEKIDPSNLSSYGFHKYLGELIVKKHKDKFLILRSSMILGRKLKKGPFYDIAHDRPIFITLDSYLQLITTRGVAEIIESLLKKSVAKETINIGGKGSFSFENIYKYLNRKIQIAPNAETQKYEMNIEKVNRLYKKLKTTKEYLQEFLSFYKMRGEL